MFRPNTFCQVQRTAARRTIHGKETFGPMVRTPCAVVHVRSDTGPSSVRADQSASRGAAEQTTAAAKVLFPPNTPIANGDIFHIAGLVVEVTGIEQRFDVRGTRDHLEVVGDIRSDL